MTQDYYSYRFKCADIGTDAIRRYFVTITSPVCKRDHDFFLGKLRKWEKEHSNVSYFCKISLGLSGVELKHLKGTGGISFHLSGKKEIRHKFLFFEAVEGNKAHDVRVNGRIVGTSYVGNGVKYLWMGPFFPADGKMDIVASARDVMKQMFSVLSNEGGTPSDIVRTWYFLSDINDDYALFNETRTNVYKEYGINKAFMPASTGVGLSRFLKDKICGFAIAVIPQEKNAVRKTVISSKIQCEPFVYGSSFSRAMEVNIRKARRLFISGTASIGRKGESITGGIEAQVKNSIKAVSAIMRDRGFLRRNIVFAMGYYDANISYEKIRGICEKCGIPDIVLLPGEICRRELLFELEVECESI